MDRVIPAELAEVMLLQAADSLERIMNASCWRSSFTASSKAFLRFDSDSPAIFDIISGPLIKKKNAPVSLATARAIRVLPVPGGPNKRIPKIKNHKIKIKIKSNSHMIKYVPLGGLTPMALNNPGCLSGSSTISLICAICFLAPPISSYPTSFNKSSTSSRLIGSPSWCITVSGDTIQYGAGC